MHKHSSFIYAASGNLSRSNSPTQLQVSGVISFDPTLRLWSGSSSSPADPAPATLGNSQYSYFIPAYELFFYTIEQPRAIYRFSGTAGCLYVERMDQDLGDVMWFLENGSGDLNKCYGEVFSGYLDDLSDWNMFAELATLPPFIRLTGLQIPPGDPIFSHPVNCDIMLTKLTKDLAVEAGTAIMSRAS